MSSFHDVQTATCRIVDEDGEQRGTGFFILPDGHLLTCHHVIFGLDSLHVALPGDSEPRPAEYVAEYSNPVADIAVLRVMGMQSPAVQVGRTRESFAANGMGFRPKAGELEPRGHAFSGRVGPGQELVLRIPDRLLAVKDGRADSSDRPWNQLPDDFRIGGVRNFEGASRLEQGISGGPIYDWELHRVVGMFRAIEGDEVAVAYVIPMDAVFSSWRELEAENERSVHDTPLRDLVQKHRLALVAEGARPIFPIAWDTYDQLRSSYERFGGRVPELQRLDDSLEQRSRGYLFVTGPAGFGKTALLSEWAGRLKERGAKPIIHFITPKIPDGTTEEFLLTNVCEQLMAHHGVSGDVPSDARHLRVLYRDLLGLSPPHDRLVVILDGLDEALPDWDPKRASLLPETLGESVYVVFSARHAADTDWRRELGLSEDDTPMIDLARLEFEDIGDLLQRCGISSPDSPDYKKLVDRMLEVTDGDPFYVQDLVVDLDKSGPAIETLEPYPIGHINYLREWWKDGRRKFRDKAFVDLMATLAVLREPMGRKELLRVSGEDDLTGDSIDLLLEDASRYIEGNEDEGYVLRHGRVRSFIEDTLDQDFAVYCARIVDFCLAWQEKGKTDGEVGYALRHAVGHLIEAGRIEEVFDLLSPEWIAEKWLRFHSYGSLLADLGQLSEGLRRPDMPPALLARTGQVAIAQATVQQLMGSFSAELLAAWTALGGIEYVTDVLKSLSGSDRWLRKSLLGVASQCLAKAEAAKNPSERDEWIGRATRFMERAINVVSLEKSSSLKLEHCESISRLLRSPLLPGEQRERLFTLALRTVRDFEEPDLRATALGALAVASAEVERVEEARNAIAEAESAIAKIEFEPDRLLARASLLPALRMTDAGRVEKLVRSELDGLDSIPAASGLRKAPLTEFLRYWAPGRDPSATWAVPLLIELAGLYLTDPLPEAVLPGQFLAELIELGHVEESERLLDDLFDRSPIFGAYAYLGMSDQLGENASGCAKRYLERALEQRDEALFGIGTNVEIFRGRLAAECAKWQRWDDMFDLLVTIANDRESALARCIEIAGARVSEQPSSRERISQLVGMASDLESSARAKVLTAAARALASSAADTAQGHLEEALRELLSELPEGDADELRYLESLCLLQAGRVKDAVGAAAKCTWPHRRLAAYVELLSAMPGEQVAVRRGLYDEIIALAKPDAKGSAFLEEIMRSGAEAVRVVAASDPDRARVLCDVLYQQVRNSRGWVELARTYAIEIRARHLIDPEVARRHLSEMVRAIGLAPDDDLQYFSAALDSVAAEMPEDVAGALRTVEHRLVKPPITSKGFENWSAFAVALAHSEPERSLAVGEMLVDSFEPFEPEAPAAGHLMRMFLEFVGQFTGLDSRPKLTGEIADALVAAAKPDPAPVRPLWERLLISQLDNGDTSVHAASALVKRVAAVDGDSEPVVTEFLEWARDRLAEKLTPDQVSAVLQAAATASAQSEQLDRARRIAEWIPDEGGRQSVAASIATAEENALVAVVTPFEKAYVSGRQRKLAMAVLHSMQIEGTTSEMVRELAELSAAFFDQLERARLLREFIPPLIAPLMELEGVDAVCDFVRSIADFDQRLVDAASIIAKRA